MKKMEYNEDNFTVRCNDGPWRAMNRRELTDRVRRLKQQKEYLSKEIRRMAIFGIFVSIINLAIIVSIAN